MYLNNTMKKIGLGVGVGSLMVAGPSFATIDVSSLTSALTDALAAVGTIGAAVLAIVGLIAAFKFVRRAA